MLHVLPELCSTGGAEATAEGLRWALGSAGSWALQARTESDDWRDVVADGRRVRPSGEPAARESRHGACLATTGSKEVGVEPADEPRVDRDGLPSSAEHELTRLGACTPRLERRWRSLHH